MYTATSFLSSIALLLASLFGSIIPVSILQSQTGYPELERTILKNRAAEVLLLLAPVGEYGYEKNDADVYFVRRSIPCPKAGCVARIPDADPATFVAAGFEYAKDKNHVYLPDASGNVQIIEDADPATFSFIGFAIQATDSGHNSGTDWYGFYAKDADSVFFRGQLVPEADSSFHFILTAAGKPTGYARDASHVYSAYTAEPINPSADPDAFMVLNDFYAKDNMNVYSFQPGAILDGGTTIGTILAGADPKTFSLVAGKLGYDAKDAYHTYFEGTVVQ